MVGDRIGPAWHRVPTTGDWTILVVPECELIDNVDGWEAYSGNLLVFVRSLSIRTPAGELTPADALRAIGVRTFPESGTERLSYSEGALQGEAEVVLESGYWELKGFMCTAGTLAACVIDFTDARDKESAVATWQSLRHS